MPEEIYGWHLPPNLSVHGPQIDLLIHTVQWFMLLLFVGWGIYFVYTLLRFRARPGHKASYESTKNKLPKYVEVGVVLFEVFLLVGLSFPVWSMLKNDFPPEDEAFRVRVVAQQFAWNIQYPGRDGVFGKTFAQFVSIDNPVGIDPDDPNGKDDIVTINQFNFPVNTPVIAFISSLDVIHSFSIPVLRVKQDAIPGSEIPIWWEATGTGAFEIQCAQLCGVGHSRMRGFVTIQTEEEYIAWMKDQEELQLDLPAEEPEAAPQVEEPVSPQEAPGAEG